ncbi:MAG: hypothetical protein CFE43_12930 [Burkholderiales bacterium PBB3]|nr:MAG: hypothetical protein CFE43_12930 [Burkholderiales bacterium PBB3]
MHHKNHTTLQTLWARCRLPLSRLATALRSAACVSLAVGATALSTGAAAVEPTAPLLPVVLNHLAAGAHGQARGLAFSVSLKPGQTLSDIILIDHGTETSLLRLFALETQTTAAATTASLGDTTTLLARLMPSVDWRPLVGQSYVLKLVKTHSPNRVAAHTATETPGTTPTTGTTTELLQLQIIRAPTALPDTLILVPTDGTAAPDTLAFTLPGVAGARLEELALVSGSTRVPVQSAFALTPDAGGNVQARLGGLDFDPVAGQDFALEASWVFTDNTPTLKQKLVLSPRSVLALAKETSLRVVTNGTAATEPLVLNLGGAANTRIDQIALEVPGGTVNVGDAFVMGRAANGALIATLSTLLDLDPLAGQSFALQVNHRLVDPNTASSTATPTTSAVTWSQRVRLSVVAPDRAATLAAPQISAGVNGTSLSVTTPGIADADGVRNLSYRLYAQESATTVLTSNTTGSFTGLTPSTPYWISTQAETYNPALDTWTLRTSLLGSTSTRAAPDTTAPLTTAGPSLATAATDTTATITVTLNEAGTGYYLVLPATRAAPTPAAVLAGTTVALAAASPGSIRLSGLTASTAYTLYFVAKDTAGNVQAALQSLAFSTTAAPDLTAPVTTAGPAATGITSSAATLSVTLNEAGSGYYLLQAAGAAAPSVAAVKAGTSLALAANVAGSASLSGLSASTAYKLYFVAQDTAGNVQAAVQSVAFSTIAPPDITPPSISLNGAASISLTVGDSYTEQGATWSDAVDGSGTVTDITGTVNTAAAGSYTRTYRKTDAAGNTGTATRTVTVSAAADPMPTGAALGDVSTGDSAGGGPIAPFNAGGATDPLGRVIAYSMSSVFLRTECGVPPGSPGYIATAPALPLVINSSTGVISGIFDAFCNSLYTVTVTATPAGGSNPLVRAFTLTITDEG